MVIKPQAFIKTFSGSLANRSVSVSLKIRFDGSNRIILINRQWVGLEFGLRWDFDGIKESKLFFSTV
jgi:hypothetical protein